MQTYTKDMIEASNAATPQTIIVAFVSFEPVPRLELSLDISRGGRRPGRDGAKLEGKAESVLKLRYGGNFLRIKRLKWQQHQAVVSKRPTLPCYRLANKLHEKIICLRKVGRQRTELARNSRA